MRNKWILRIILGITGAAVAVVAGLLIWQKVYYGSRWYNHTSINGVDVSKLTLEASKQKLIEEHQDYTLTVLGRDDGSMVINGKDIDYVFEISDDFDKAFSEQHEKMSLSGRSFDYPVDYDVTYDPVKLRAIVNRAPLLTGRNYKIVKPVNAHVEYSSEKQRYECVAEVLGNKIKKSTFLDALDGALQQAKTEMDLTDGEAYPDVYKVPGITSEDPRLEKALTVCNNAALRYIRWNMGKGVKEQITPDDISKWITYKKGKLKYDDTAIADWIEAFCLKYKTVGMTRTIRGHAGNKVKIYGGDYGWQMDYEATLEQAKKALKKKISKKLTTAYIDDPSSKNKKALLIKKKVIYLNTAFRKDYKNFAVDWDTQNYTEISIAEQAVYVIRKGKVAFSCKCITGLPVVGRSTPTGAYFIKEHRPAYTLKGADYATPVVNWVRITWTGTGFHPATWQPWSIWSSSLYKSRGSHGCINLQPSDAQVIYNMTKYREAVFIH